MPRSVVGCVHVPEMILRFMPVEYREYAFHHSASPIGECPAPQTKRFAASKIGSMLFLKSENPHQRCQFAPRIGMITTPALEQAHSMCHSPCHA